MSEGTYELSISALDASGQRELDVRQRYLRFDVVRGTMRDGGVVSFDGEWELDPAPVHVVSDTT